MSSLLNNVKNVFKTQPQVISYTSGTNYEELPLGFFRVQTASGKKSLGYRNATGWVTFDCGETVVDGGARVTLSVPRSELQVVELNFSSHAGVQHIGNSAIIDTDDLGWDGETVYDGVNAHGLVGQL